MKIRRNRKGFTIVELIIVIAVIAVLAAILIPTFIHLANKAGDASDVTVVKNANTQLAMKQGTEGRNYSMSAAVKDADEIGYHIPGVATNNGNKILWDSTTDRFVLVNKNGDVLHQDAEVSANKLDLFCSYASMTERGEDPYSFYAKAGFEETSVSLTSPMGFDAGDSKTVTSISYVSDSDAVITIATNAVEQELTVEAPNGGVIHDGVLGVENIAKIKNGSLHEHGKVGFAEMQAGNTGKYVAEKQARVKALWFSDADAHYEKLSGAVVEEYAASPQIKTKIEAQLVNDEVIAGADKDTVKEDAIEALDHEVNPAPEAAHVLTDLDKEKQAEGYVFRVGETYYKSLATCDLFEDDPKDGYYIAGSSVSMYLIGDITDSHNSLGLINGSLTIDLNGYTFIFEEGAMLFGGFMGSPALTIRDSGTDNGGVFSTGGAKPFGDSTYGVMMCADSTINIEGGTFSAPLVDDNFFDSQYGASTFNISGGKFVAHSGKAIFGQKNSTFNITGGTFDASASGSSVFGFTESDKAVDTSAATIIGAKYKA